MYDASTTSASRSPISRGDRLLRGAGPGGRGQDVRRGRVLGHGLRHSRLPHRDRHAEAARRWHPDGTRLELASFVRPDSVPGSPAAMANELGLRNVAFEATTCRRLSIGQLPRATDWSVASASTRAFGGWPTSGGRKGLLSRWPSASAEPRNARICRWEGDRAGRDRSGVEPGLGITSATR